MIESLISAGTIGWLLVIIYTSLRRCADGHWASALLGFVMFSILAADIWAILPQQILRSHPGNRFVLPLLWAAAVLPYFWGVSAGIKWLYFNQNAKR